MTWVRTNLPIAYKETFMRTIIFIMVVFGFFAQHEARAKQDFSYGADQKQAIDVYFVEQPIGMIVMLESGSWPKGDKSNAGVCRNKAAYWGQKGYLFVSVNTRLLPQADPIEQACDLSSALALAQDIGARAGVASG